MLHAIYHNKGKLWQRYVGHRDGLEGNVHAEDEITSAFLGTQVFLDTVHVWKLWQAIVGDEITPPNETLPPASCAIKLWPKKSRIEPDALITFAWPNDVIRHLLIEFKWDAGESGDNQLIRQWDEFLTADERNNSWHLFIAKDISPALPYCNKWRIRPITWLHVRSALCSIPRDGKLAVYCDLMDKFFLKIKIYPFKGFRHLPESCDMHTNRLWHVISSKSRSPTKLFKLPNLPDFPQAQNREIFFSISQKTRR